MRRFLILAPAFPLALAACDNVFGGMCTTDARAAIEVSLTDSETAHLIDGANATATLRYEGQMLPLTPLAINEAGQVVTLAGGGRAGSYDIAVDAPGYRRWTREGVRVANSRCGVVTTRVEARLQPATP